jgi:hypothetical protein
MRVDSIQQVVSDFVVVMDGTDIEHLDISSIGIITEFSNRSEYTNYIASPAHTPGQTRLLQ